MAATCAPLGSAPVLSTPDTHIFEEAPAAVVDTGSVATLSDEQIALTYEIERTVSEIRAGPWKRIALQFPDHMLTDGPRVYEQLSRRLAQTRKQQEQQQQQQPKKSQASAPGQPVNAPIVFEAAAERLFILGDTSYGACCVDQVAAEHVDADVVVHYGRSCLSPPSRLPVIYVFTERPLDLNAVLATFQQTYPDKQTKVLLMADIPYSHHMPTLHTRLRNQGYTNTYATNIVHNPSSPLPNRTIPAEADTQDALRRYALFHISDPPTALLLTLSSRVASIHIYPTTSTSPTPTASQANAAQSLRRRYALLTSLSTTPIFGILINTLSVKNYMHILSHVQGQIAAAGKKSYTFVVGKVNAAKVANFSEVGGWVVIGCWESSLIESKDFWRPMITPWELELALKSDEERVWTGSWEPDFQRLLNAKTCQEETSGESNATDSMNSGETLEYVNADYDSDEESAPPEFDLRTGRYVSHSRPMRSNNTLKVQQTGSTEASVPTSSALTTRMKGDVAAFGGVASPGAEFLRSQRTWQGLGSDCQTEQEYPPSGVNAHAAKMEQGRSGIAKGYLVGEQASRH